ncbi:MAG: 5'-methylthioadenosine/S-adenosylhomocysteine nucleosidase [Novosphingobium sp. 28-62-57]|uniref:5'-methylthioadenosine/S-adenosylhomocysteine nucleosidase n=1 Tax=unclassified Novosphingobium TaxID=2644732 RepID=UPI000BCAC88F|nr:MULTISPECIES: 5'-methylthioadenosine/S-adenosylhomocysteine nucleosidase [unclassified Novosphingobium]OYW50415.1 MAG: 5'-methylthioadenosine/S-adenosylhomocysteine nucleosidase [Novosphingobium sp. 12-62-10]OYZ11481.1 MAG: 5'-methylthioadenosine/S-adenosylhomocysteine nucleosidase [Novosphingobium sp. 28-62-57]OZA31373.1 MAG: 5'-methylthioadenosine/S-adenosylhomocysteine nucleosidase [Novosphingobium sp. 17-62-9]
MELTSLGTTRALFVMAAEPEYGPQLRARFTPLITGIGPVEAALHVGIALARLEAAGELPDLIVCLGSAGSRRCALGSVHQIGSVSWRDIDASALGIEPGVVPYLDEPKDLPLETPLDLPVATLSTGGDVVSGAGWDRVSADMVDMETYAVARAAHTFGVPLIGLRGVSDGPGELAGAHDWHKLLGYLDGELAKAVDLLAAHFG